MNAKRLVAILAVFGVVSVIWLALAGWMGWRSVVAKREMKDGIRVHQAETQGLVQKHLELLSDTKNELVRLTDTVVKVDLTSKSRRHGVLWERAFDVGFQLKGMVVNEGETAQNVRVRFTLPKTDSSYEQFRFQLGERETRLVAQDGVVESVVMVAVGAKLPLQVAYVAKGRDRWEYEFPKGARVRDFELAMVTNFDEVSIPPHGAEARMVETAKEGETGSVLEWRYEDVIDARNIAVEMPMALNGGPVVARITLFAPVSLLLFFAALIAVGMWRGIELHPVQYGLIAAGFFAFHALLAYLLDVMPLGWCFVVATLVSLVLVSGYLYMLPGAKLALPALVAQVLYLVAFSGSFFVEGFTGLTLTLIGIVTLAALMLATARVDWEKAVGGVVG